MPTTRMSIVIVDEAYVDFAGRSAMELIDKYENLIVVQTFSKAKIHGRHESRLRHQ